ncbi:hypothetical protein JTE90_006841, partial [Oedothorax gibbosus]
SDHITQVVFVFCCSISVVFFLYLCCFNKLAGQRSPTISFISQEKVVNIGDTVQLDCSVQYAEDYSVIWLKTNPDNPSDQTFISSGTNQIVPGDRYGVTFTEATGTYALKVSEVFYPLGYQICSS